MTDPRKIIEELVAAVEALPMDSIICYASTVKEYKPNAMVKRVNDALAAARALLTEPEAKPESSIDFQQLRGAGWDVVQEAIQSYNGWMLEDDYDAVSAFGKIIGRMKERYALYHPKDTP